MCIFYRTTSDCFAGVGASRFISIGSGLAASGADGCAVRSLPLHGYIGTWRHPALGPLHIAVQTCQASSSNSLRSSGEFLFFLGIVVYFDFVYVSNSHH